MALVLAFVLVASSVLASPRLAGAQADQVVLNEVMAVNTSVTDSFGETPDWIELENLGDSVDLDGWTIAEG